MSVSLKPPHVRTTLDDAQHGVKYHIVAYRTLTLLEAKHAVNGFLADHRGRRPRAGEEITIFTIIGWGFDQR